MAQVMNNDRDIENDMVLHDVSYPKAKRSGKWCDFGEGHAIFEGDKYLAVGNENYCLDCVHEHCQTAFAEED
jgi:hypothetical protein